MVVLNYNGRALLPACLGSLAQLSTPARLVLADNGSSDGSLDAVRQRFPAVEALDLGRNWGFAAGYNHLQQPGQLLAGEVDCNQRVFKRQQLKDVAGFQLAFDN